VDFICHILRSLCTDPDAPTAEELHLCTLVSADMYSQFCEMDQLGVFATAGGLGVKSRAWFFERLGMALGDRKEEYVESLKKRCGIWEVGALKVYVSQAGTVPNVFAPFHLISQAFTFDHVFPPFWPSHQ